MKKSRRSLFSILFISALLVILRIFAILKIRIMKAEANEAKSMANA